MPDSNDAVGLLQGARVLVVDDEEDSRMFLSTVLEDEGAEVLAAAGGDEALEMLRRESFDVMTLDLEMPGKNGIEVFAELRGAKEPEDLPVCVVTGHPDLRALIYGRSVRPPEGFLTKPVEPEELLSILRRILGVQQKRTDRNP
jgi:CheY-like chemotaxis protein